MIPQASSGTSASWVNGPRGLRGPRSSQRAMTEATLPAGGSGAQVMVSVSDSVPPCICRAEGASQSGLDPPLRSAHSTVPEIRHARQKCATSLRLNFRQRADLRLAATVT